MEVGYVYFIKAEGMDKFKIGKAAVLLKRFGDLDTASPCEISVWGIIRSKKYEKIERQLHSKFNAQRLRKRNGRNKEWFAISEAQAAKAIEVYGGIYTAFDKKVDSAEPEVQQNEGGFLVDVSRNIQETIERFFPSAKPAYAIIQLCAVVLFVFSVVVNMAFLNKWYVPKVYIVTAMPYLFVFIYFALNQRINLLMKLLLIAMVIYSRYLIFGNTYSMILSETNSLFATSLVTILIFIAMPFLFYQVLIRMSEALNGLTKAR